MRISIVLPAYKEAENLTIILPILHKILGTMDVPYEILVIDTMEEMDNTKQVCKMKNAHYISRIGGNDYGDAIRTGIIKAKGELILIMDADGSHSPEYIPTMYACMVNTSCDVVIGSRYTEGGNSHNNILLKFMSRILNVCYRIAFHINVIDVSDSFRLYNGKLLKGIELLCQNFDIVEEILIRLMLHKPTLKLVEIPIFFNKRLYGKSKRNLMKFILCYLSTMKKLIKIKHNS